MVSVKRGVGTKNKQEKLSDHKERLFVYFLKSEIENYIRKAGFRIIKSKFVPDYLNRDDKETKWIEVWGEKKIQKI